MRLWVAGTNDIRIWKDRSRPTSVPSPVKWKNPVRNSQYYGRYSKRHLSKLFKYLFDRASLATMVKKKDN